MRSQYAASEHRVCGLMSIAVSSYRYRSRRSDEPLRERLVRLAREKPRYGYRRLQVLVEREGERVNHKRLWRVYREAGLCLKRKKRKHCVRIGSPRPVLSSANQEWALDFAHDVLAAGRNIRVLSVVDAFTRECLALEVDTGFASRRVTRVLDEIIAMRGLPQAIRCDNVRTGTDQPSFPGLGPGVEDRTAAYPAGHHAERACGELPRQAAGRVPFHPQNRIDHDRDGACTDEENEEFAEIIGCSSTLAEVLDLVRTVTATASTVLIEGETGTGKELIARAIHECSQRRSQPFVKLNCAAIPLGLLESELFGHERGAFTGAVARRVGRFEAAHGGTLFLDEAGDIPSSCRRSFSESCRNLSLNASAARRRSA